MIQLTPFTQNDFERFIAWVDSKELLITIAGNYFTYPLTIAQLQTYLDDEKSFAFNILYTEANTIIGHAELSITKQGAFKIDKLLFDKSSRGKGLCYPVMQALTTHAFEKLHAPAVELYVFDWNTAAIKCYEKAGFVTDTSKTGIFEVGDKKWTALNMRIIK